MPYFVDGQAFNVSRTILPPLQKNQVQGDAFFQGLPTSVEISLTTSVYLANPADTTGPTGLIAQLSQITYGQVTSQLYVYNGVGLSMQFPHSANSFRVSEANSQSLLNLVGQIGGLVSICFTGASFLLKALDLVSARYTKNTKAIKSVEINEKASNGGSSPGSQ